MDSTDSCGIAFGSRTDVNWGHAYGSPADVDYVSLIAK